jgi:hypothetical protein
MNDTEMTMRRRDVAQIISRYIRLNLPTGSSDETKGPFTCRLLSRLKTGFGVTGPALSRLESGLRRRPGFNVRSHAFLCLYVSPLGTLVITVVLYIALLSYDRPSGISQLESCLMSLHSLFCQHSLCLNPSRSLSVRHT